MWKKFTDKQTRYLLKLTEDLVRYNTVKKETIWCRVVEDKRALELGLISRRETEEEIDKAKQRLADKVRHEAKKLKLREQLRNKLKFVFQ